MQLVVLLHFLILVFNATATGASLTASSGALNTDTSSTFDVIVAPIIIAQEDFDGSTPSWPNDISDQTFVDPSSSNEGLFIQPFTHIGSGNTAFGKYTEGEAGEPTLGSTYTFTFDEIYVSNFSNITFKFDFYAFANADEGSYQLIIDGVPQTAVEFYNDPDTTPVQGTITESIGSATTIGLIISGSLNGGSDVFELDNFILEGDYDGNLIYAAGSWTPNAPDNTTGADDALVQDGTYSTSGDISLNAVNVLGDATVEISSTDVLTINNGIFNNGDFIFKSDANGTAQLADATGVTISGDVEVQRYIPVGPPNNTRSFRFLTSTVDSTDPIFDNWQESGNSPAGFGTHITGDDSGADGDFNAATGIDYTLTGNPSMFTFDNTNSNGGGQNDDWQAITDTKSKNLVAGEAYQNIHPR